MNHKLSCLARLCIIALLTVVCHIRTTAQNEALDSINLQLRQLFSPLAKPASPKWFLYDMAAHVTDSNYYQTNYTAQPNNTDIWFKVYEEMYHSAYDTTALLTPDEVFMRGNSFFSDTVPIGIMHYDYYTFKAAALTTNTYFNFDTVNTIITDKSPRPGFPYNEGSIFIASPLVPSARYGNPVYRIDPQLIFFDSFNAGYYSSAEVVLKIDFDDGNGWVEFDPSIVSHHQVTYTTAGEKTIRVALGNNGGGETWANSNARLILPTTAVVIPPDEVLNFPGVTTAVYRSCNANGATGRTVIYLSGFDALDFLNSANRTAQDIYTEVVQRDQVIQLRNLGYDFMVVDWRNSRIDMRFNALYLVNLLQQLKCDMRNEEQFVIMGESMGAVIARYALLYMESQAFQNQDIAPFFVDALDLNNVPYLATHQEIFNLPENWCLMEKMHNTRLLLSLDGPHQGANIPISLQLAYRHAMNIFGKYVGTGLKFVAQAFNLFLDGQAAQQLLIYHLDTQSGSGFYKTYDNHPDRSNFMGQMLEMGNYPQFAKVVLMSNGSLTGEPQTNWYTNSPRNPNDRLLEFDASLYARVLWIRVPIFGGNLAVKTNPDGQGHVFNAQAGFYGIRIKLKWFGIKISIGYNSLLFKDDYADVRPYCTSSGGWIGSQLVRANPRQDEYHLANGWLFDLFHYEHTVHGDGCITFNSHVGLNGFASVNFDYSMCSDGGHFCLVPVQSALDYGAGDELPLDYDIQNNDDINQKLTRIPDQVDVIVGFPGNGTFRNQTHVGYRNDNILNLTQTDATWMGSAFFNTYFSCIRTDDFVRRGFVNLEIGDEELYLENNTLPWDATYVVEYDMHINNRNPYYEYPGGTGPLLLDGIYSRENDFINNATMTVIYDQANSPTGIGIAINNPTGTINQVDQPLDHCCTNLSTAARKAAFVSGKKSIKKQPVNVLSIYPNPNMGHQLMLKYKFMNTGNVRAEIFNSNGQRLLMKQLPVYHPGSETTSALNLGHLNLKAGLYLVRVTNGKQTLITKMLIAR